VSFPQASTHLAIVDPATLAVRRRIELHGDFSFDAISPDGRWVYVIQYTSRSDPTRYRVRALDAPTGTLLPGSIVDPRDRGEAMHGNPLTRATSADGSLAFTLYDGNGHPFVHALDTATGTARCIDVPQFPATFDPFTSRLVFASGQSRLLVRLGTRTLATIDTGRLVVVRPRPAATAAKVSGSAPPSDAPIIAVLAAVGLLAAGYGARRVISHRPPAAEV
jgi:hypothetical protein